MVEVVTGMEDSNIATTKKPPLSPRPQSASPKPPLYPSLFDCEPPASIRSHSSTRVCQKPKVTKPRIRSSSAGRTPDLRARYWALLFENLRRAVDEIYQTCELDESELESEETILILENYTKDFRSLVKWLKLSKDLETSRQKPTSLAWEVRKTSPAKGLLKSLFSTRTVAASKLPKTLNKVTSTQICSSVQTDGCAETVKDSESVSKEEPQVPAPLLNEFSEQKPDCPKVEQDDCEDKAISNEVAKLLEDLVLQCVEISETKLEIPDKASDSISTVKEAKPLQNTLKTTRPISAPINTAAKSTYAKSTSINDSKTSLTNADSRKPTSSVEKRTTTNFQSSAGFGRGKRISSQAATRTNFVRRNQVIPTKPSVVSNTTAPYPTPRLTKDEKKTGSTSSISSTSSCHSWADKVKGISNLDVSKPEKSPQTQTIPPTSKIPKENASVEDTDGWETVHRGRTRSRNSPIKKAPSESALSTSSVKEEKSKMNTAVKKLSDTVRSNSDLVTGPLRMQQRTAASKNTNTQIVQRKPFLTGKMQDKSILTKPGARPDTKSSATLRTKLGTDNKTSIKSTHAVKDVKTDARKKIEPKLKPSSVKVTNDMAKKEELTKFNQNKVDEMDDIDISGPPSKEPSVEKIAEKEVVVEQKVDVSVEDEKEFEDPAIICKVRSKLNEDDLDKSEDIDDLSKLSETNQSTGKIDSDLEDELNALDEEYDNDDEFTAEWLERKREQEDLVHEMGLSWAEQMDRLDLELRTPGRALQVHEKLSSPFKKRTLSETIRLQEEKQAKAQELREKLLVEKKQKLIGKGKKAEEMKAQMEEQLEQMRITMEIKLQKAEEKRKMQLRNRVRKAKDEEDKVNEIAFINTLEAQNKRHDLLSREKDHEARLTEIQEERLRKLEEKAAKEAAAEERRKALEAERQARLLEMQEKRKLRDMKIEQQQQVKEKERQEMANQKARDREQRLSALSAAQQATVEELQKKIQLKLEESARRHEESIEQIRQKAFELNVRRYSSNNDDAPRLVPYETKKMCSLCNVLIGSEVYLLSHLRGKKHQEAVKDQHQGMEPPTEALELYNLKHIVDATADRLDPEITLDKERQKALRKRCKKIRQRMINRGSEWEKENLEENSISESDYKQKFQKNVKDIRKHLASLTSSSWENNTITNIERSLGEFERSLDKSKRNDQMAFRGLEGLATLVQLLELVILGKNNEFTKIIPNKTLTRACVVYKLACQNCFENCLHTLHANKIVTLLDLLTQRLNSLLPDNNNQLYNSGPGFITVAVPTDPVAGALLETIAVVMTFVQQNPALIQNSNETKTKLDNETSLRIQDVVSYTVSMGILDKLSHYLKNVQAPLDSEPQACEFILQILGFLTSCAKLLGSRYDSVFQPKKEDNSQLLATFRVTELAGAVSLLYGTLLHSGAPSRGESKPPQLSQMTEAVTLTALRMLNHLALLDIQIVQTVLGSEGLSLQLRHIASYLLWYCSHWHSHCILHEVILLVGYFAVMNPDNQTIIQSGQRPTVLQQLCCLPFQYFSDPQLTQVLFPALVACCYEHEDNKVVLEQDMSCELLSNFLEANLLDIHQGNVSENAKSKGSPPTSEETIRWCLSSRFPKNKWTSAKQFFSIPST